MSARFPRQTICRSWLKTTFFILGLGTSSAALAAFVWARFPLLEVMNGATINTQGYEIFKGTVNETSCNQNTQKTPNSRVVIQFEETLHPDWDHVDGWSGASTREKQLDEIYSQFKLAGRFVISQINDVDINDAPLTGHYSGNAKKLNLQFDDPEALIHFRGICKGDTAFAVQSNAKHVAQFSAVFSISNSRKAGSLSTNAKLFDQKNPNHKSTYSGVFKTIHDN